MASVVSSLEMGCSKNSVAYLEHCFSFIVSSVFCLRSFFPLCFLNYHHWRMSTKVKMEAQCVTFPDSQSLVRTTVQRCALPSEPARLGAGRSEAGGELSGQSLHWGRRFLFQSFSSLCSNLCKHPKIGILEENKSITVFPWRQWSDPRVLQKLSHLPGWPRHGF